jgi:hypothetical protein
MGTSELHPHFVVLQIGLQTLDHMDYLDIDGQ